MAKHPLTRFAFNTVGTLSVSLGVLGIFLPLLPTTPFLLLAFACYMRGSECMAHWMLHNSLFGAQLRNFQAHRAIPKRTKIWAISLTWVSLAFSAWLMPVAWARWFLLLPGLFVTVYLWRHKTLVQ